MAAYWDTSCLLKLYCRESDSQSFLDLAEAGGGPLITSVLAETELFYALLQKENRQEIGDRSAEDLYQEYLRDVEAGIVFQVPFGSETLQKSREVAKICYGFQQKVFLRSLDGLHLASALEASCSLLVSTDDRMQTAAKRLGLSLFKA